jgi:hypothetical protein
MDLAFLEVHTGVGMVACEILKGGPGVLVPFGGGGAADGDTFESLGSVHVGEGGNA